MVQFRFTVKSTYQEVFPSQLGTLHTSGSKKLTPFICIRMHHSLQVSSSFTRQAISLQMLEPTSPLWLNTHATQHLITIFSRAFLSIPWILKSLTAVLLKISTEDSERRFKILVKLFRLCHKITLSMLYHSLLLAWLRVRLLDQELDFVPQKST
jgi:hypothetical protein